MCLPILCHFQLRVSKKKEATLSKEEIYLSTVWLRMILIIMTYQGGDEVLQL